MATACNSFEYTATGILGDKRQTMLKNELHLRSELARSKQYRYTNYPGRTFCHGLPYPKQSFGVKESLMWNDHSDTLAERSKTVHGHTTKSQPAAFSSSNVFGIPARPSTPIHEVLEFKYQDEWIEEQQRLQMAKLKEIQAKTLPPGSFRENRSSQLRQSHAAAAAATADKPSMWQMSKFSKAQSHLDTFQSAAERIKTHKVNCTSVVA